MRKYDSRRLIRTIVRRHLIIYNYLHGLDNTHALWRYNNGYIFQLNDTKDLTDGNYIQFCQRRY